MFFECANNNNFENSGIRNNALSAIPSEFGQLPNINILEANGNELTKLPTELFEANSLRKLYLFDNRIEEIPSQIGKLDDLREFSISGNLVSSLPSELKLLTNLDQVFSLFNNRLVNVSFPLPNTPRECLVQGMNRYNKDPMFVTNCFDQTCPEECCEQSTLFPNCTPFAMVNLIFF